jgi:hypothetical protein
MQALHSSALCTLHNKTYDDGSHAPRQPVTPDSCQSPGPGACPEDSLDQGLKQSQDIIFFLSFFCKYVNQGTWFGHGA